MKNIALDTLPKIHQKLIIEAKQVIKNSYSPYSGYKVGAAVLTLSNKIITGTNYECAAYGDTICAEKAAITAANSAGYAHIKAIAIIAEQEIQKTVSPCGSCRQLIAEAANRINSDILIYLATYNLKLIQKTSAKELLPFDFKL